MKVAKKVNLKHHTYIHKKSFVALYECICASQVALIVSNLPMQEMQEMKLQSLGPEGPLEEGTVTHSRIFSWL